MKTTVVIGGALSGIAVAHNLQKKGTPKKNVTIFDNPPSEPAHLRENPVYQPDGPFRQQLDRELDIGEVSRSSNVVKTAEDASRSVGHYVWKDQTTLWSILMTLLLAPMSTIRRIWLYSWFISEAVAVVCSSSSSDGEVGIRQFCMKAGYRNVWQEYLLPLVSLIWGVTEEAAGIFDAKMVFSFMHEKNLLQVWSPHLLLLSRRNENALRQRAAFGCNLFNVTTETVTSVQQDDEGRWKVNGKGNAFDDVVFAVKPSNARPIRVETMDEHRPDILSIVDTLCEESFLENGTNVDSKITTNGSSEISSLMNGQANAHSPVDTSSKQCEFLTSKNVKVCKEIMKAQGSHGIWVTGSYLKHGFDDDAVENAVEVSQMLQNRATDLVGRSWSRVMRRTDLPLSGAFLCILKTLIRYIFGKMFHKGCIGIVFPDSSVEFFGQKGVPVAMLNIHRMRCIPEMFLLRTIGFGMAYRDEHFTTDNLTLLVYILLINIYPQPGRFYRYAEKLCSIPYQIGYRFRLGINPVRSKRNSTDHYGLEDEIFNLFLDESRLYSSAYFKKGTETLFQAQMEKLDLILGQLEAKDGERLLDMGCGWGAMCTRAALKNNCKVTGITNSHDHKNYCTNLVLKENLQDRVEVYELDYRDLPKLFQGNKFDKIAILEVTEHIGADNYSEYFKTLESVLAENGKICIQMISRFEDDFDWNKGDPDFVTHFIFPGACVPSLGVMCKHASRHGLVISSVLNLSSDYAKTLYIWREKFNRAVLNGTMLHDAKFARMWNMYFVICEASMAANTFQDFVLTFERFGETTYSEVQTPVFMTSE